MRFEASPPGFPPGTPVSSSLMIRWSESKQTSKLQNKTEKPFERRFGDHHRAVTSKDGSQHVAKHFNNGMQSLCF